MKDMPRDMIDALVKEQVDLVAYDPSWARRFTEVRSFLLGVIPDEIRIRIEHIGSTAVPGCYAKPIIDVQVEVTDLETVKRIVVPVMEAQGHTFIWRPSIGEQAPFYAWFIMRNEVGIRTHHIHVVESDRASEDRILFRDHLVRDMVDRGRYELLKRDLAARFPNDRAAYTNGKTEFITSIIRKVREGQFLPA